MISKITRGQGEGGSIVPVPETSIEGGGGEEKDTFASKVPAAPVADEDVNEIAAIAALTMSIKGVRQVALLGKPSHLLVKGSGDTGNSSLNPPLMILCSASEQQGGNPAAA